MNNFGKSKQTSYGFDTTGIEVTNITRHKISQAMKGRTFSEETKNKLSKKLKGRTFTPEWLEKLKGEKSEQHKQAMRENHADFTGNKNPFYGRTHSQETRKKIADRSYEKTIKKVSVNGVIYNSLKDATQKLGLAVNALSDIINGRGSKNTLI